MNSTEALRAAEAAGVELFIDGGDLLLEAATAPPASVIDALRRHKSEIIAILHGRDGWSVEDWQVFFDERAAIAEFDSGLRHVEAEAQAFACCVVEWLNRNPAPCVPGRCAWCGEAETASAVILPFGTEPETHAWLHADCWPAWYAARKEEAIAALTTMGVGR